VGECGEEVVVVPSEGFPADLEAGLVGYLLDDVESGVSDGQVRCQS
jgi:hypothetical protein